MFKRSMAFFALLLVCALVASTAGAEAAVSGGKSYDGIYYFTDIGLAADQLQMFFHGYQVVNGAPQLVKMRPLEPREFTVAKSPEGILAIDIHLDATLDTDVYLAADFVLETPKAAIGEDSRSYYAIASNHQQFSEALYLYSIKTQGLSAKSIEQLISYILMPNSLNVDAYIQTTRVRAWDGASVGFDDADTLYFVGGEMVSFQMRQRERTDTGINTRDLYVEKDFRGVAVGESATATFQVVTGDKLKVTANITKVAILRELDWPENAIGQIVVIENAVNVREGGGTDFPVVGKVSKGDIFFTTGQADTGWYAFEWADGQTVYISQNKVTFTPR